MHPLARNVEPDRVCTDMNIRIKNRLSKRAAAAITRVLNDVRIEKNTTLQLLDRA